MLICYYLYQWNCPSSIVQALETGAAAAAAAAASHASGDNQPLSSDDAGDACHHVGSRTLLLALAWLMGHCRLFERVVEEQLAPVGTHAMLPPWPRDSALCAATHDTYWQAVQQQQAQVQGILQACHNNTSGEPPQPGLGPFDDSPAWAGVEAASHSAVMLLGKARAQLSALQSLLDCRARLQQAIRQAQSGSGQQRGQAQEGAGGSGASWELSPFEAHLLCNGKVLEAHAQALEAAAAALTQQQELATNARLFYSWMASVVGEDAKAQGLESWAAGKGAGSAASPAGSAATQLGTASMLHSLQRLPDCGSAAAAGLLQHLDQQLQAAVEATAAWLSAARTCELCGRGLLG